MKLYGTLCIKASGFVFHKNYLKNKQSIDDFLKVEYLYISISMMHAINS